MALGLAIKERLVQGGVMSSVKSARPSVDRKVFNVLRCTLSQATSYSYTSGSTHHFYHYPARFAPAISRAVISSFSSKGDWILDPFMGGGTSIIEGLSTGRRTIGIDINALAHFVASVRTRPISKADSRVISEWAEAATLLLGERDASWIDPIRIRNLPSSLATFMSGALALTDGMLPRRQAFIRCALLRLGQWALEARGSRLPRRARLSGELIRLVGQMTAGINDFTERCQLAGVGRRAILRHRILRCRSAIGLDQEPSVGGLRPTLVVTSPPYPGVNVLYHRWQYRGRKETPAPYWIADIPYGCGQSYYTGGSRTPTGLDNYFSMITRAFLSIRKILSQNARVVQLIGFSNAASQLPRYLHCMRTAGFEEIGFRDGRLGRSVPNRRWYARLKGQLDASTEVLLIHRLAS